MDLSGEHSSFGNSLNSKNAIQYKQRVSGYSWASDTVYSLRSSALTLSLMGCYTSISIVNEVVIFHAGHAVYGATLGGYVASELSHS